MRCQNRCEFEEEGAEDGVQEGSKAVSVGSNLPTVGSKGFGPIHCDVTIASLGFLPHCRAGPAKRNRL